MRRRDFLRVSGLGAAGGLGGLLPGSGAALAHALDGLQADGAASATDEDFWRRIRRFYTFPIDYIDLDHANTSPTPSPVFDAFAKRSRWLSHTPAERFGTLWGDDVETARSQMAAYLGTQPERLALLANATAGLNTVLHGFPLSRGDEVLVTDHEYPDMVQTILQRARRAGIVMRVVHVPSADEDRLALVTRIAEAITSRTRLLLISHVSAWSGEILPVAEITAVARAQNVAVLVDAAQSVGMLDVNFDAIGSDFLAAPMHKWLGAPLPTGALVMRQEHVGRVYPLHPPSWDTSKTPMDLYEWAGTRNIAGPASITDALVFQRT